MDDIAEDLRRGRTPKDAIMHARFLLRYTNITDYEQHRLSKSQWYVAAVLEERFDILEHAPNRYIGTNLCIEHSGLFSKKWREIPKTINNGEVRFQQYRLTICYGVAKTTFVPNLITYTTFNLQSSSFEEVDQLIKWIPVEIIIDLTSKDDLERILHERLSISNHRLIKRCLKICKIAGIAPISPYDGPPDVMFDQYVRFCYYNTYDKTFIPWLQDVTDYDPSPQKLSFGWHLQKGWPLPQSVKRDISDGYLVLIRRGWYRSRNSIIRHLAQKINYRAITDDKLVIFLSYIRRLGL